MQQYEAIENGIKNKDVKALREAIGSICYTSRDFSSGEFDEAIQYVESKGIQLKDEKLIGDPTISSQKDSFTDDDFADAIFELKNNFCDERIKDVKNIGKKLYGSSKKTIVPQKAHGTSPKAPCHQDSKTGSKIGLVAIVIVVIVVLLILRMKN